jgi:hypothetical protein
VGSRKQQALALTVGVAALVFSASALAADPPPPVPPGTPSISQYIETVPTSHGGTSPGGGAANPGSLSPVVVAKLSSRPDGVAKRLKALATSSKYGAPQRDLSTPARVGSPDPNPANPLSAAVSAVSDGGDGHIFWLLAALIVVTTTMVWATARRLRRYG